MDPNRFANAGWASIASAVIFPLAFILAGLTEAAFGSGALDMPVHIGPADFLFLLYAALSIYVLKNLKRLMYEYYSFRGIGTIIEVCIWWNIVFFGGSFLLSMFLTPLSFLRSDIGPDLAIAAFWIVGTAVFGILDIILGVILMRSMRQFSTPIKAFAVLCLIMGVCEATIILSFFTLILVPITAVLLAIVFLQRPKEVEFV